MVGFLVVAMVLVGTIADQRAPVAVFTVGPESTAVGLGGQVDGWTIVGIEPKRVTMTLDGKRQTVDVGQTPQAAEVVSAVQLVGNQVTISSHVKEKLSGTDLVRTLMQTASAPIMNPDGSMVGYKLFEIDDRSIYQVVGFVGGDVVTDIDGKQLNSPVNALSALMGVKIKDRFTVGYLRAGESRTLRVSVMQ